MDKKTVLYDKHVELGGKMTPYGGYLMPLQYSSIIKEHQAVREAVGVFDVSHMGEFLIKGEEAAKFLDYLLTNPMSTLAKGRVRYSPMCNLEGGTKDDLIVYALEDGYMLVVNAANLEKDAAWIQEQIADFAATFEDISEKTSLLAIQGPDSKTLLPQLIEGVPTKYYRYTIAKYAGEDVLVSRTGYTGEYGFEVYGSHDAIVKLWDALMEREVTPCGLGARDTLRLEAGLPLYGQELAEDIRPDEADLGFAIKLEREPFIGQATLKTSPKRQLIKLKVEGRGIVRPGQEVFIDDEKIGVVTSGTQGPSLGYGIGMALVDRDLPEGDMTVQVRRRRLPVSRVLGSFLETD